MFKNTLTMFTEIYVPEGKLVSSFDTSKNSAVITEFDDRDRMVYRFYPEAGLEEIWTYDEESRIIFYCNSKGDFYQNMYDKNGNLVYHMASDKGNHFSKAYDENDRPVYSHNRDASFFWRYNSRGETYYYAVKDGEKIYEEYSRMYGDEKTIITKEEYEAE